MIALITSKLKILVIFWKKEASGIDVDVSILLNTWLFSHCQIVPLEDFLKVAKKQFSGHTVL